MSRTRVHAEKIRAGRDFDSAMQGARSGQEVKVLLLQSILKVFLVFAKEATRLGYRGIWSVAEIDARAREFLRRLTIEFDSERGHGRWGHHFPKLTNGSILPEVQREFERLLEWKQYEDLLLEVADRLASIDREAGSVAGPDPKRGYRSEVREWMAREGVRTIDAAAKRLGISESALKSIMSDRGKRRYAEETLARVLGTIAPKGE